MVILWYGVVPIAGALLKRYKWHLFRRRFDELRLSPMLDYSHYCRPPEDHKGEGKTFRFTGGFESVTDGQTLWIRSEDLTVPVSLQNAETYLLPTQKGAPFGKGKRQSIPEMFDPGDEAPEKIRWDRVSTLTEGAKVFVGGLLLCRDGQWSFVSTKEKPLIVIFYDGPDDSLTIRTIRAGRRRGEYWNAITPYALVIGAISQIFMAMLFLPRPAFRLTVMVAIIALFVPLYPMIPPGLLFTVVYRRLAWRARILRAYRDLARLPLRYLPSSKDKAHSLPASNLPDRQPVCLLPDGELYGFIRYAELPPQAQDGKLPLLLPEFASVNAGELWHIFGVLRPGEELPSQPEDPCATFGILPGDPETLAHRFEIPAYILEFAAWLILFAGIGLNIFFLRMVLFLL